MMAGALNFTLGLQANQFLNSIGVASGKLVGFLGITTGIEAAFHKMWGAIEKGGALKDLAAAANLSVRDLYRLQRAFEDVGASAESVPLVMNRLRRTLASGEQNGLLTQLGLNPTALGKMDPAAQFEKISTALSKLNVNSRSQAAFALFGREGATIIQQIANSGGDFAEAMQRAGKDATVWDRVATAFDAIGDKVKEIQAQIETMWAALAGALIVAFKEGHLLETLFDIFSSVFQAIGAALPGLLIGGLVKIGEILLRVLQVPLTFLQTGLDAAMQGFFIGISKIPGLRDTLGIPKNFQPESWGDMYARNKEKGLDFFGASLGDMSKFAADQITGGLSSGKPILEALYERLVQSLTGLPQGASPAAFGGASLSPGSGKRPELTSLEKIGLVVGGRGISGSDFARQTADSTRQTVNELKLMNRKLNQGGGDSFTNLES